jgi:integrase/recombinase XerD
VSTAAVDLQEHVEEARPFFSPQVVRHDSILAAMEAVQDCYGYHVKDFFTFAEDHGGVSFETVKAYFIELNTKAYANGTKRLMRQAVKARLRAALDSQMDFNAAAQFREALAKLDRQVKAPKTQQAPIGQDKVITRDQFDRLVAAASCRDELVLRFLWATGCRVSELTGILLARCTVKDATVYIPVIGKGNKERTVRIRLSLFDAIRAEFKGSTYLFETASGRPLSRIYISERIRKLSRKVLKRTLGAHSLRHAFATRQIRRTGKIQAVSAYLGHSTPAITMSFYVHESLDDADLFDPEDGE